MNHRLFPYSVVLMLATFLGEVASASDGDTCVVTGGEVAELMIKTKVVAVPKIDVLPSEFRSDGDPNTVELVFLQKRGEKSHVSDDGEVVFLKDGASDKVQQDLMVQAFATKLILRKAAATGCNIPR